jgi:predicted nucleotide-binding protein
VAAREIKKAYDQTFVTEQEYWFRILAKPWQQQEVYNERNSHFITLKDIESVMARLRTSITNYLAGAEASVVAARNAAQQAQEAQTVTAAPTVDKRKVFVVYGQDEAARSSLFSFLRAAGLDPMEWNELVQLTAKTMNDASPYVGDIIDVGMSQAQAVVVLFTGDEEAVLRSHLVKADDAPPKMELQPRPNVILEAGMALAKYRSRTILVQVGKVRAMSDILGRFILRMDNSIRKRKELMDRLNTAECAVNYARNDWMTEATFPEA